MADYAFGFAGVTVLVAGALEMNLDDRQGNCGKYAPFFS